MTIMVPQWTPSRGGNYSTLRPGDYFIRRAGQHEAHPAFLVRLDSLGQSQRGEFDLLIPVAVGIEIATSVDRTVDDGVVAHFFTMTIATHQEYRRQFTSCDFVRNALVGIHLGRPARRGRGGSLIC